MSWNPQLMPCSACQNHPHQILQTPLSGKATLAVLPVHIAENALVVFTLYHWLWICMQWVHTKALEVSFAYFNTLYRARWPCGCMRSHAHCSYPEHSSTFENAPLWTLVSISNALTFPLSLGAHNHIAHRNYNNHKHNNSFSSSKMHRTLAVSRTCNKPRASASLMMDAIFKKPGVSHSHSKLQGKHWDGSCKWNHMKRIQCRTTYMRKCDQKCMTTSPTTELWNTLNLAGISVTKLVEREQSLKDSNMKAIQTEEERHWKDKAHDVHMGKNGKRWEKMRKGCKVDKSSKACTWSWRFDILGTLRYF